MNGTLLPTLSPTRRGDVASTRGGGRTDSELGAAARHKGGCKREEGGSADGGLEVEDRRAAHPACGDLLSSSVVNSVTVLT